MAFIGNLPVANNFFSSQGFACPTNYNPADFYIKTLAIAPGEKAKCQERVQVILDKLETKLDVRYKYSHTIRMFVMDSMQANLLSI